MNLPTASAATPALPLFIILGAVLGDINSVVGVVDKIEPRQHTKLELTPETIPVCNSLSVLWYICLAIQRFTSFGQSGQLLQIPLDFHTVLFPSPQS